MPNLQRFKEAQDHERAGYASALSELSAARKSGHWIWYVFPQLAGLGDSPESRFFGINGVEEATDYLRDRQLRDRLFTVTTVVAEQLQRGVSLETLMASRIDAVKLVSSLTLFEHVAQDLDAGGRDAACGAFAEVANHVLTLAAGQGFERCRRTASSFA